ncbi:MAG TPA: sugar ABC transporter permease [Anaerolineae bacterium]|nr:sugar ABC transporter permease [Anaerolineae bacterium]
MTIFSSGVQQSDEQQEITEWQRRGRLSTFGYLLPALIVMGALTFYPLVYQFYMSFMDYGIRSLNPSSAVYEAPEFVGLENYQDIFDTGASGVIQRELRQGSFNFWRVLSFNLFWTVTNVLIYSFIGVVVAIILNIKGLWLKTFYRGMYILPVVIPTLVMALVWVKLFDPENGGVNYILGFLGGLIGRGDGSAANINWFGEGETLVVLFDFLPIPLAYIAMLSANVWLQWPFMTMVTTSALQSVPDDLYEAAMMDGASYWQQLTRITLPLIRSAVVPAAMISAIWTFNSFEISYFIRGGDFLYQTEILVTVAFRLINQAKMYGLASAFVVIIFIVLAILTFLTNMVTRASERYDE